jgi:hypothetical protein
MPNPEGINQYTGHGGAEKMARDTASHMVTRARDMAAKAKYPEDHRDAANAFRAAATHTSSLGNEGATRALRDKATEHDSKAADSMSRAAKASGDPSDHAVAARYHRDAAREQMMHRGSDGSQLPNRVMAAHHEAMAKFHASKY